MNGLRLLSLIMKEGELQAKVLQLILKRPNHWSWFILNKQHFGIHRFHPPLVYGRRGGPDEGEGIAICQDLRNGDCI